MCDSMNQTARYWSFFPQDHILFEIGGHDPLDPDVCGHTILEYISSSSSLMVSSSLYVSHMFVNRVLSSLVIQSCPSLELVSPQQVTHVAPLWDLFLLPLT